MFEGMEKYKMKYIFFKKIMLLTVKHLMTQNNGINFLIGEDL